MPHAFLFDTKDSYLCFFEAVKSVLTSSAINNRDRIYIFRTGNLLFINKARTMNQLLDLAFSNFNAVSKAVINEDALIACLQERSLFCVVIEGMDNNEASLMHRSIHASSNYIGYHSVRYSIPIHFEYYRQGLSRKFRIYNNKLEVFYKMGDQDNIDPMWLDELGEYFTSSSNEDDGAHDTIFDEFNTLEHLVRVDFCLDGLISILDMNQANNLILIIEDINPQLSDNIYSAIRAIENFKTVEDSAQTSLSIRRFIESLANTLFSPKETAIGEKRLDQAAYRNRIWQYITNVYNNDVPMIAKLGKELDRLDKFANKGLHGEISDTEARQLIGDVLSLTKNITASSLPELRRSAYPFRRAVESFLQVMIRDFQS